VWADVQLEKTQQNLRLGVQSFDKTALKPTDTVEKVVLPGTEVIAQEKGQQQLRQGIEQFQTANLNKVETLEKNPLPTQEAIEQEKKNW